MRELHGGDVGAHPLSILGLACALIGIAHEEPLSQPGAAPVYDDPAHSEALPVKPNALDVKNHELILHQILHVGAAKPHIGQGRRSHGIELRWARTDESAIALQLLDDQRQVRQNVAIVQRPLHIAAKVALLDRLDVQRRLSEDLAQVSNPRADLLALLSHHVHVAEQRHLNVLFARPDLQAPVSPTVVEVQTV